MRGNIPGTMAFAAGWATLCEGIMPRKYSRSASRDVESAIKRRKKGTLRSGKGGRGGKVRSRKQAVAIGLSDARKKGKKVPEKATKKRA